MSRNVHTFPAAGEHLTNSLNCWCRPQFFVPCDDCDGAGCWKCGRGLVEINYATAADPRVTCVIVHRCDACEQNPCVCEAST